MSTTTYYVRDSQDRKVSISDADFVASGGEKSIFAKSGTAYCVYHDATRAVPISKFDELRAVKHKGFVGPLSLLLDSRKQRVGETMPFVAKSYVLCQLFAKSFRRKHGIDHKTDIHLITQMVQIMNAAHAAGVTLVDANDMNWLVSLDFKTVYLIDTSSCQTPTHKATAIKPAIFDPKCRKQFNESSDYYSIAIVIAWLWCGVHPFCCQHKNSRGDMESKMKSGLSIFDSTAELNAAMRSPNSMPSGLRKWARECLETDARNRPPMTIGGVVSVPKSVAVQSGVTVKLIGKTPVQSVVAFDEQSGTTLEYRDGRLHLGGLFMDFQCDHVFSFAGKLYAVFAGQLAVVSVRKVNGQLRSSHQKVADIADAPNATHYGTNCIVQNLLGRAVVTTPDGTFPVDIDGSRVIYAVYRGGVLMLSAVKSGVASRWTLILKGSKVVDIHREQTSSPVSPNFAVTRRGVVIENREGVLGAWHKMNQQSKRTATVKVGLELSMDSDVVVGDVGGKRFSISMN